MTFKSSEGETSQTTDGHTTGDSGDMTGGASSTDSSDADSEDDEGQIVVGDKATIVVLAEGPGSWKRDHAQLRFRVQSLPCGNGVRSDQSGVESFTLLGSDACTVTGSYMECLTDAVGEAAFDVSVRPGMSGTGYVCPIPQYSGSTGEQDSEPAGEQGSEHAFLKVRVMPLVNPGTKILLFGDEFAGQPVEEHDPGPTPVSRCSTTRCNDSFRSFPVPVRLSLEERELAAPAGLMAHVTVRGADGLSIAQSDELGACPNNKTSGPVTSVDLDLSKINGEIILCAPNDRVSSGVSYSVQIEGIPEITTSRRFDIAPSTLVVEVEDQSAIRYSFCGTIPVDEATLESLDLSGDVSVTGPEANDGPETFPIGVASFDVDFTPTRYSLTAEGLTCEVTDTSTSPGGQGGL